MNLKQLSEWTAISLLMAWCNENGYKNTTQAEKAFKIECLGC
jgi:hypothetical protein